MEWSRGRTIGRGSSATVSIATIDRSDGIFAVKSAELSQSHTLQKEQSILSTLKCPQIIAYQGWDITHENDRALYNIFLEYAPGGTLIDAIRRRGGCLDETVIRLFTRSILIGLEYLHSSGIVHCDIKCHNILVTADHGAKIADLGCARRVDEVSPPDWNTRTPIAGTPLYMAPEVARGEDQGLPSDIWALGCTVIQMATGQAPWVKDFDPVSALYHIGFSGNVPEIPSFMSKQAKDFLSRCFKINPMERWSASELLKHPFINEGPNFVFKETNGLNADTPTSILDQGLWDSIGKSSNITFDLTYKSSSNSPLERIRQLAEGSMKVADWDWDDTWVIVRSNNCTKQGVNFGCNRGHNLVLLHDYEDSGNSGKETDGLSEEYDVDIPNEATRDIISGENSCATSSSSWHVNLLLMSYSRCTKDASHGYFNLEKERVFCFSTLQFLVLLILLCETLLAQSCLQAYHYNRLLETVISPGSNFNMLNLRKYTVKVGSGRENERAKDYPG